MEPQDLSNRLQRLYRMYLEIKAESKRLIYNAPNEFMGDVFNASGSKISVIITIDKDKGTYVKDYPHLNRRTFLRALRDDQIPLYINEEGAFKEVISNRLKGTRKEIPILQDLMDRYEELNSKAERCINLISILEKKIISLIYEKKIIGLAGHKPSITPLALTILQIGNHEYILCDKDNLLRPWNIERIQI